MWFINYQLIVAEDKEEQILHEKGLATGEVYQQRKYVQSAGAKVFAP